MFYYLTGANILLLSYEERKFATGVNRLQEAQSHLEIEQE